MMVFPPVIKPKAHIVTGIQGVNNSHFMRNTFRLPYRTSTATSSGRRLGGLWCAQFMGCLLKQVLGDGWATAGRRMIACRFVIFPPADHNVLIKPVAISVLFWRCACSKQIRQGAPASSPLQIPIFTRCTCKGHYYTMLYYTILYYTI